MTHFQEQRKEMLVERFKDDLSDIDTSLGNALYKNARDYNPSIKTGSLVEEKINSLPEAQQKELLEMLDDLANAMVFSETMNFVNDKLGLV